MFLGSGQKWLLDVVSMFAHIDSSKCMSDMERVSKPVVLKHFTHLKVPPQIILGSFNNTITDLKPYDVLIC